MPGAHALQNASEDQRIWRRMVPAERDIQNDAEDEQK
jgi:hypothetical protein